MSPLFAATWSSRFSWLDRLWMVSWWRSNIQQCDVNCTRVSSERLFAAPQLWMRDEHWIRSKHLPVRLFSEGGPVCWQETFSRRDTSANESVHSLCVAIPRVINKNPSRPHQWQSRLLLRTSLLSDLIAQSSAFKGKRPLTSDIKGAHQRACDHGGTAEGGTTFGSALIPF